MSHDAWHLAYELRRIERMWLLPTDATPLERVLAYEPRCFEAGRQQNRRIAELCRELGLRPPWASTTPEKQWPPDWHTRKLWPYPHSGARAHFLDDRQRD
jgi:hypothetical protein